MKAGVYYKKNDFKIIDAEVPVLWRSAVKVKVHYCGVCGTDMHICRGMNGAAPVKPPIILGHECAGVVEEVGADVTAVVPGDRVAVDPNLFCGTCYFCKKGQAHFCENFLGMGTVLNGAFAEYVVAEQKVVYKIPDGLDMLSASLAEPVACCLHGMDQTGVQLGDTVAIIGAGSIGVIMLQLAKRAGASCVVVIETVEEKRKKALGVGADIVIDPMSDNPVKRISEAGIQNVDKVIECAGRKEANELSIEIAGKGATVMWFGLTDPKNPVVINQFDLFLKEITVKNSFVNPYTMQRAIDVLAAKQIDTKPVIGEIVSLDELPAALEDSSLFNKGKAIVKCC